MRFTNKQNPAIVVRPRSGGGGNDSARGDAWGVQPFNIPHSVIVDACRPAIYVADRCVASLDAATE
jgi:hypothetical protein